MRSGLRPLAFLVNLVVFCGLAARPAVARAQEAEAPAPPAGPAEVDPPGFVVAGALAGPREFRFADQPSLFWRDGKALFTKPLHWEGADLAKVAVAGVAIALLGQEDRRIDAWVASRRTAGTATFTRWVSPLGEWGAVAAGAAALGGGLVSKNSELRDTGRDALEAAFFAGGVVSPILKGAFGRTRPRDTVEPGEFSDPDEFRGPGGGASFPSGHSTTAFAVASVFAARSKGWVVPALAYSLASAVAFSRVHDRAHYTSDVAVGALLGTAIGHTIVRLHRSDAESGGPEATRLTLEPFGTKGGGGIAARLSF